MPMVRVPVSVSFPDREVRANRLAICAVWPCGCYDCEEIATRFLQSNSPPCSCNSCAHAMRYESCGRRAFHPCHVCLVVHTRGCLSHGSETFIPNQSEDEEEEEDDDDDDDNYYGVSLPSASCPKCGRDDTCTCSVASLVPEAQPLRPMSDKGNGFPHFSGRRFGVEIECYGGNTSSDALSHRLHALSHEILEENYVDVGSDGSIEGRNPVEVRIGPVNGRSGLALVERVSRCLAARGFRVNASCGLHVHHDLRAEPEPFRVLALTANFYGRFQRGFSQLLSGRRWSNSYCEELNPRTCTPGSDWYNMWRHQMGAGRYMAVNLEAYSAHRTVEFRQHHASLIPASITNWVVLTQLVVNKCTLPGSRRRINRGRPHNDLRELFRQLIDPKDTLSCSVRDYYKAQARWIADQEGRMVPRFSVPNKKGGIR